MERISDLPAEEENEENLTVNSTAARGETGAGAATARTTADRTYSQTATTEQSATEAAATNQTTASTQQAAGGETNAPAATTQQAATEAAGEEPQKPKKSIKKAAAEYFTATRVAFIAVFTAIAFVLRYLEFPVVPAVSFLKLDFSNVFPLLGGYALGPVAGVAIGVIKELLWIFNSSTGGVGEIANILVMLPFVLIPSLAYKKYKGIKSVVLFLTLGCLAQVLWSFPVNLFLNFPVFLAFDWNAGMSFFMGVWYWVMAFNLVKVAVLAVLTLLMYKPVSELIKATSARFSKKRNV